MRYIFVTGGVTSSLGKGIAAASLGNLLKNRGLKVKIKKLDPYLNLDPGTMNPSQHGEVFITDDGVETDLDLGHYERFVGINCERGDNITAGGIYWQLLQEERKGRFLGSTVQVVPHVTDAAKRFIRSANGDADLLICEIGGTVGDIEGLPFLEAIRQIKNEEGAGRCFFLHLTLVPWFKTSNEFKTKPTQHAVKTLLSAGIQPDALLLRSEYPIGSQERRKISLFCNVPERAVIPAADCDTVYAVPLDYHKEKLDELVCSHLRIGSKKRPNLKKWRKLVELIRKEKVKLPLAVVGKYTEMLDCYKSLAEALHHGALANKIDLETHWIDSEKLEKGESEETRLLHQSAAVLVPGGFGRRGSGGKIDAITYARVQKVPFLGICFGMQMAVLEALRRVAGMDAGSSEFAEGCQHQAIGLLTEWDKNGSKQARSKTEPKGATMRLGAYPCLLATDSLVREVVYKKARISERHRHRYEVNINYAEALENCGVRISGVSPDKKLPEIIERVDHPWFVGVQFHPELKSRPLEPHPLFVSFVAAAIKQSRLF